MLIQNRFMKLILFFLIVLGACTGNLESRHNPSGFKIPLPEKDFDSYKNKTRITPTQKAMVLIIIKLSLYLHKKVIKN